eukprot:scaffold4.g4660.t1
MGSPAWCEDEELLASIYGFAHRPTGGRQTKAAVSAACKLWARFATSLAKPRDPPLWPGLPDADRTAVTRAVGFVCSSDSVTWLPEYACALLVLRPPAGAHIQPAHGLVDLALVGLDMWGFMGHSTNASELQPTAVCSDSQLIDCGSLPAEHLNTFRVNLQRAMSKAAEERKGDARSATGGNQRHQKMPGWVCSLVLQAREQTIAEATGGSSWLQERLPQSGWTDVGLHTGCVPRDTAWPLVRETIKTVLNHVPGYQSSATSPDLFQLSEAHLRLWVLNRQAALVTPDTACALVLNAAMRVLATAAEHAAALAERGHDVAHFEVACAATRRVLEHAAAQRAQQAADEHTLPPLGGPGPTAPAAQAAGAARAAQRPGSLGFGALLAHLQAAELKGRGDNVAAQHALCMVEHELFARAAGGFAAEAALEEAEDAALAAVVDDYRSGLWLQRRAHGGGAALREVLLSWVAFCIMRAAASRRHPDLQPFGVALDWRQLRHLVLSDRQAVDAALAVAAYLRRHTGRAVFSLRDGGAATFELAERYARGAQGGELRELWRQERAEAEVRKQAHWRLVRQKQQKVARLRVELGLRQAAEAEAKAKYDREYENYQLQPSWEDDTYHMNRCKRAWQAALEARISTLNALSAELQSPTPVIQPLPNDESVALRRLVFLYTPAMLRELARMSFLAQQLLLPRPPSDEVRKAVAAPPPKAQMADHYDSHQTGPYNGSTGRRGSEGAVRLVSNVGGPDKVKLGNVNAYTSADDGVYHPDSLALRLGWCGSGHDADAFSGWTDPFASLSNHFLVEAYTEQLPKNASALQFAMPQYGTGAATAADRGNVDLAQQDAKPHWLSKPGYLAFGTLRAYPLTQIRQLCTALHERALPLGQPAVQALVRQTLYHLGTLTDAERPGLLWRTDWGPGGDMLPRLCAELGALAAELDQAPREHAAVLLLGEVAPYLSDWHAPLHAVARQFAATAERWAAELEPNALEAPPDQARPVRAKQCLLRCTSVLCHGAGALDAEDVKRMLRLAAQVHHGAIYGQGTSLENDLARLQVLCHWSMARRASEVLEAAAAAPSMLTAALRSALDIAPERLSWGRLRWPESQRDSASFQARGRDGHLYSINCLDGKSKLGERAGACNMRKQRVILLRPHSFRDHSVDFVLQWEPSSGTLQPVELVCLRVPSQPPELRTTPWRQLLADHRAALSDQLVLHSSAVTRVLSKFELPEFIHTYVSVPAGADGAGNGSCVQSGSSEDGGCMEGSSSSGGGCMDGSSEDSLCVDGNSCKEELEGGGQRAMLFELPRFRLSFELRGGRLRSLDYSGFCLRPCQQLVAGATYTLPGLQQCLVLEAGESAGQPGGDGRGAAGPQHLGGLRVLVPEGKVQRKAESSRVEVEHSDSSGATLKVHSYDAHFRFGNLVASARLGRLQLAALYAATGSLLPESGSQATGAQIAMRLVRHSWGMRPLAPEELAQLASAARLGGHMAAGLPLLVHELQASAAQLNALHFPDGAPPHAALPACDPDWRQAYVLEQKAAAQRDGRLNARLALTTGEEERTLAHLSGPPPTLPPWKRLEQYAPVEVPTCPVAADVVAATESALLQLVVGGASGGMAGGSAGATKSGGDGAAPIKAEAGAEDGATGRPHGTAAGSVPPYPLRAFVGAGGGRATQLEEAMHAELEDSFREHHSMAQSSGVVPGARERILQAQAEVQAHHEAAEAYLREHLASIPAGVGLRGAMHRLLQSAATVPLPGQLDYVQLALHADAALDFNPFLSRASLARLQQGARTWLQLCVLEDRLGRLERLSATLGDPGQMALLIQASLPCWQRWKPGIAGEERGRGSGGPPELEVHREWSVDEHSAWLVFEAEGQLQIRPTQYRVASDLMQRPGGLGTPGAMEQLNMGEGKTRVILPMLVLHWANGSELVRLHFLPPLLEEGYAHLHSTLCASALGRKLFVLPFHRDVKVTKSVVEAMRSALTYCQQEGGVLLTTPERRLSLLLKRQELWQRGQQDLCAKLDALATLPYTDLLDESDELPSHRYQLIYAWGAHARLPAGDQRARACQALLHILSKQGQQEGSALAVTLAAEGVAVWAGPARGKPGAFAGLRLLPGPALEAVSRSLRRQLAEALFTRPPYAMRWMRGHPQQDRLMRLMTDPEADAVAELKQVPEAELSDDKRADVLALRGLLACGVLEHCLQLRHLVNYGINLRKGVRKRLAVPFRAAHQPAERSEYAQPDTAVLLTCVAYYCDGLSGKELMEALQALLRLGRNAQREICSEWLKLAGDGIPAGAVDFWLNTLVLPAETQQFPERLVASAWHMADNARGRVCGFSGTNDNHRLLPLQVKQHLEVEQGLRATNGKMLSLLLENRRYDTLEPTDGEPVWEALLRFAVREGLDALLDCGALLAGTSNRRVGGGALLRAAAGLLRKLLTGSSRFRGVCYFDEEDRCWSVLDLQGRRLPRHVSPIQENQAFTIFDEARCRGADLELRPDAVGLLTLSPTLQKDKLMQGAGRLRRLGKGQRLRIVGTADITEKIARLAAAAAAGGEDGGPPEVAAGATPSAPAPRPSAASLTSLEVLGFVMANTVLATLHGVLEWAHQGLHFAATRGAPDRALVPEVLELERMYGDCRRHAPLPSIVAEQRARRVWADLDGGMAALMEDVVHRSATYGAGHEVVRQHGLGEECERELEREEEEEEEVECEVPRVTAREEVDWSYAKVLDASSVEELRSRTGLALLPLRGLAARLEPGAVGALAWSGRLFCTPNFANAVELPAGGGSPGEYLRPVDALLLLPAGGADGEAPAAVLVSEREANGLLEQLWARGPGVSIGPPANAPPSKPRHPVLASLCYAAQALQPARGGAAGAGPLRLAARVSAAGWAAPPGATLAAEVAPITHLQLFNGETTFVDPRQHGTGWETLGRLPHLRMVAALAGGHVAAAEALVAMRGKAVLFARSQLEQACSAERWGRGAGAG